MRWMKAHLPKLLAVLVGTAALGGGAYYVTKKNPEDHLQAGIALHQKGDLKGAEIELKNALQKLPDNADARYRLGRIHFANNDYQSAAKELKKSWDLGVRDGELDPMYARTLLKLGEPKRLLEEVNAAENATPETKTIILALRARAQLHLKDFAASEKSLSEADALSPEHPETRFTRAFLAIASKKDNDALTLVEKALAKAPNRADFLLLKGDLLLNAKQNNQALEAYSQALNLEPDNIQGRLARARIFLEASDLDKAAADLKELHKHSPNNVMGRYLEAFIEFKHSRFSEANEILQGVLRVAPSFLPGHLLAGADNIALGNREAARFHLEKVLGAAPQHPLARKLMAATMADLGDLDKAKEMLATFGNSGGDSLLNVLQGQIALRQGDFSEARKHLEQASEESKHNPKYFTDLAASRMGSGDEAGAVAALNKAAELDTDSARPEVLLVLTHLKEKRFAEALKVVDKLEKERPDDPLVHNLRGAIYLSQEDATKARASFAKAVQIKPDYFPATSNLAMLDMRAKDAKSARARFQQLLEKNPKESRAWLALASLDAREGKEKDYLNNLEQAKKANEKLAQPRLQLVRYWLGKKEPSKALVEARSALDATGHTEFNEFIGLALAAQGDHVNALVTFSKWAETNPKNPVAQFRLAQAQITAKDTSNAIKSLDKALALKADFAEAAMSKALLLGEMGRADEGIKIARALQTKAPKAAAGFLVEAEILFRNKRYAEAAKLFEKTAQLTGQGQLLARAYQAYKQAGQAEEGEQHLEQWLKTHPKDMFVRHELALAQFSSKRWQESAENYRILARANPRDLAAANNLALALGELKDPESLAVAEQALKIAPKVAAIQDTYGWLLVSNGQAEKGLPYLREALKNAPDQAEIRWHVAAALAKTNDTRGAQAELDRLLTSRIAFPQEAEAKALLQQLRSPSR
jgi:putative PEP-CTERM system TPR-repeat lipoprotein